MYPNVIEEDETMSISEKMFLTLGYWSNSELEFLALTYDIYKLYLSKLGWESLSLLDGEFNKTKI